MCPVAEADLVESVHGTLQGYSPAKATVGERQGDVVQCAEAWHQVEVLVDEA